ncbi:c-type cytochrome [Colwellia sp. Bg11-28]|uniref:c-type cytochrome n=1 Tax=Colwellia sp. Bg11-28 TaxID=2058305 RepID=UPI000C339C30|nr:cytochrome c [Colwellia sp. Bg11-28]PKH85355.1 hypothetical protein CXF79_18975 [Colwellia sp. Bg11-28]
MSSIKITLSGLALATHLLSLTCVTAAVAAAVAANDITSEKELSQARKDQLTHIVKQDCGSCHGMTLKGGLGPALLPENLEGKSVPFLQHTILYGRTGTAMPPWKPLLTEQEALWISQQLKAGKVAKQ